MKTLYVQCLTDDASIHNGGFVKTSAKTDAGIMRAARIQIWSCSPAALCGYRLTAICVEDGKRIIHAK